LLEIKLDTSINDITVTVNGRFGLRDWSGDWDDEYDGSIDFVVLADLATPVRVLEPMSKDSSATLNRGTVCGIAKPALPGA
jgi:hypothetical protein